MNLIPFFESSAVIQFHVYAALVAVILGAIVLRSRKGTNRHKMMGRIWAVSMIVVSISSFWIHEIKVIGLFSPIHLLSILVLFSLGTSVYAVRNGNVARHQKSMKWLYFTGLILPGLFTLLPGRLLSEVFFEPAFAIDFVGNGTPSMLDQIMMKTPIWVWPLFVALVVIGWLHTRTHQLSKRRIFILPITFSITALIAAFSTAQPVAAVVMTIIGALIFISVGHMIARSAGAQLSDSGKLEVPGERLTLILFLSVFAGQFTNGVVGGANPELAGSLPFIAALSMFFGAVVGIAIGRAIIYRQQFDQPNFA